MNFAILILASIAGCAAAVIWCFVILASAQFDLIWVECASLLLAAVAMVRAEHYV